MDLAYELASQVIAASAPWIKDAKARDKGRMWRKSNCLGRSSSPRRNIAESAGESVSALKAEMAIENAMVSENCLYRIPVVPGKNETGTNTAISTSDVAMTALVTSPMAREVASCGSECYMAMWRCTFSMTTIASSTTSPVASVMPKSVNELMEKPKSLIKANVPMSETGMVTAGMMVARQSSKKRKITTMTMTIASESVTSTSRIESPTTVVASNAMAYSSPGGKLLESSFKATLALASTSRALAFESCSTPMPLASRPMNLRVEL